MLVQVPTQQRWPAAGPQLSLTHYHWWALPASTCQGYTNHLHNGPTFLQVGCPVTGTVAGGNGAQCARHKGRATCCVWRRCGVACSHARCGVVDCSLSPGTGTDMIWYGTHLCVPPWYRPGSGGVGVPFPPLFGMCYALVCFRNPRPYAGGVEQSKSKSKLNRQSSLIVTLLPSCSSLPATKYASCHWHVKQEVCYRGV